MRKLIASVPILLVLTLFPVHAQAEWFYFGGQVGGQYFDMDALSGGMVYDQAIAGATENYNAENPSATIEQPQPTSYSAEGAFVWGIFTGVSLGRVIRLGARFTHSFMEVTPEGGENLEGTELTFDMDLLTIIGELQFRIPINMVVPWLGLGFGYAYLGTDGHIASNSQSQTFEGFSNALNAQVQVGIDFHLGDHFLIGFGAHFSFIGFYYEDPEDPRNTEAAWGFVSDYVARLAFRI